MSCVHPRHNTRLERTRHEGFFGELRGRAAQAQRSALLLTIGERLRKGRILKLAFLLLVVGIAVRSTWIRFDSAGHAIKWLPLNHEIQYKDKLRIRILDTTCDQTIEVSDRGTINVCFVDEEILAAGKTLLILKQEILVKLKERLRDPKLEIKLVGVAPNKRLERTRRERAS